MWGIDEWVGEPVTIAPSEHNALAWPNHEEMTALQLADPRLLSLSRAAIPD